MHTLGVRLVALVLLLLLLLGAPSLALAEPDAPAEPDTGGPTLACSGHLLPRLSLERSTGAVTFRCSVSAAADETSFDLSAWLLDPDASDTALAVASCSAELDAGAGICTQAMPAPSGATGATLQIAGSLQPSGRPLGPVMITVVSPRIVVPLPHFSLPPSPRPGLP